MQYTPRTTQDSHRLEEQNNDLAAQIRNLKQERSELLRAIQNLSVMCDNADSPAQPNDNHLAATPPKAQGHSEPDYHVRQTQPESQREGEAPSPPPSPPPPPDLPLPCSSVESTPQRAVTPYPSPSDHISFTLPPTPLFPVTELSATDRFFQAPAAVPLTVLDGVTMPQPVPTDHLPIPTPAFAHAAPSVQVVPIFAAHQTVLPSCYTPVTIGPTSPAGP
eukprot:TRINITY_DN42658_c0_g1_i1.p2 TRINITY_DN42658_c0_g1~~TRINITY_DN42658_c0_g1_i1.p2  ORF type:complete len:220 (+),score=23.47 TRINITY_DN42658_c0_g1_i1:788-1447(+)